LRNNSNIVNVEGRTNFFLNSFLPKTSKDWNDMDVRVKLSVSTPIFRSSLKKILYNRKKNNLYDVDHGPYTKHLSRLRMSLSGLREHLFRIKVVSDPLCQYCKDEYEDPCHYLLRCPQFNAERIEMLSDLINLTDFEYWRSKSEEVITSILLYGSNDNSHDINIEIHNIVIRFIKDTDRFIYHIAI
jgi:hypothetical protein